MDRQEAARLLGVPADATGDDVQHAYVRLVRHTHPDTMPAASPQERAAAAERFDALVRARDTLADPAPLPPPRPIDPAGPPPRRRSTGVSLVALAIAVFVVLAVVSLGEAFHLIHLAPLP